MLLFSSLLPVLSLRAPDNQTSQHIFHRPLWSGSQSVPTVQLKVPVYNFVPRPPSSAPPEKADGWINCSQTALKFTQCLL